MLYCFLRMTKLDINIVKINMVEKANLESRIRKIDEARNYLLDKTKHTDFTSEKYKKHVSI